MVNTLDKTEIRKIAVFRALQLGDLLNCIPAIRALSKALPAAEITLISLPWAESLVSRYPSIIHSFIWFPGYPGLPEQAFDETAYQHFVERMRGESFDLLLQMQGNGTIVNEMISTLGARYTSGFYVNHQPNALFIPYPGHGHEIERHLTLIRHLGIADDGTDIGFQLTHTDLNQYQQLRLGLTPKQYICIHPGSRGEWRQWPPAHFAVVANLCSSLGYTIVLTGTESELGIVNKVIPHLDVEPVVTAGRTSLGALAVLVNNARLLISNCTGVAHLAAALKVPGVVISMDGEPERWGPLNKKLHRTIDWTKNGKLDDVLDAARQLLSPGAEGRQHGDHFSTGT